MFEKLKLPTLYIPHGGGFMAGNREMPEISKQFNNWLATTILLADAEKNE